MILGEKDGFVLRTALHEDVEQLVTCFKDWETVRWLTLVPYPYTQQDSEVWFKKIFDTYSHHRHSYFVIADKKNNHMCGAVDILPENGKHVLGYWLNRECRGKGLMPWAVQLLYAHVRENFGWEEVIATVDPDNKASARVLEKSGFENKGLVQRWWKADRGPEKMFLYERK